MLDSGRTQRSHTLRKYCTRFARQSRLALFHTWTSTIWPSCYRLFHNLISRYSGKPSIPWPIACYTIKRLTFQLCLSASKIQLVAASTTLPPRLFGIAIASFSSGLGEMTFLQRTTCYHNDEYAKKAVGWFSSGTGAAGLVGAALWWELRALGVKTGISISSVCNNSIRLRTFFTDGKCSLCFILCQVLPVCLGLVYFLLLPKSTIFRQQASTSYMPISTTEDEATMEPSQPNSRTAAREQDEDEDTVDDTATVLMPASPGAGLLDNHAILKPSLSTREKMELARPLLMPFMIPLFVVYFAEVSRIF